MTAYRIIDSLLTGAAWFVVGIMAAYAAQNIYESIAYYRETHQRNNIEGDDG